MESIAFKVGEHISYSLLELSEIKSINPLYIEVNYDKVKTIEFSNGPLNATIPQAISKLEESDNKNAAIILPVEIKESNKLYNALLAVIHNYVDDYDLKISIKYNFDKKGLNVGQYELLEYNNLFESELKQIETEFVRGLLTPKLSQNLWISK